AKAWPPRWPVSAAVSPALLVGLAGAGYAADAPLMPMKAPADPPPPASCTDLTGFFLTDCQLKYYGIRFFGNIDVGYGYQTHGAPFDPNFTTGASYFLQKMNRNAMWGIAPSGLGQSSLGFRVTEPLGGSWSFVGELEAGFDPYSLQYAASPMSLLTNTGIPVA